MSLCVLCPWAGRFHQLLSAEYSIRIAGWRGQQVGLLSFVADVATRIIMYRMPAQLIRQVQTDHHSVYLPFVRGEWGGVRPWHWSKSPPPTRLLTTFIFFLV